MRCRVLSDYRGKLFCVLRNPCMICHHVHRIGLFGNRIYILKPQKIKADLWNDFSLCMQFFTQLWYLKCASECILPVTVPQEVYGKIISTCLGIAAPRIEEGH